MIMPNFISIYKGIRNFARLLGFLERRGNDKTIASRPPPPLNNIKKLCKCMISFGNIGIIYKCLSLLK
jgi:hypothetical protein